jgi:hypothetical protein
MMPLTDLEEFVGRHRPHGILASEVGHLTPNGNRLHIACPCGVTFERCITPEEANRDLIVLAQRS